MDPATRSAMIENGELSALSVPLWFEGEPVGILVLVETRDARRFSEHEFELARGLGEQAAVAIHNAHLYRRLERQNSKLSALLGSSRALTSTVVLEEVLHTLAAVAAEALRAPSCYIYEYDAAGDAIIWRSEFHSNPEHRDPDPPGTRYPLDDYPWDRDVLASGRMRLFTIDDPTLPPAQMASMREWDELSMLTVPLRFGDETVGMMEIAESRPERTFDTDEIELARALGEQAAAAIRNAQLYRRETWRNERLVKVLDVSRIVSGSLDAGRRRRRRPEPCRRPLPRPRDAGGHGPHRPARKTETVTLPDDALVVRALGDLRRRNQWRATGAASSCRWPPRATSRAGSTSPALTICARSNTTSSSCCRSWPTRRPSRSRTRASTGPLEQQAITDGLTGLYNHRHFYERLEEEVARAERYGYRSRCS